MSMSELELQVYEMYYIDGMKEAEIAESTGLSLLDVNEMLAVMDDAMRYEEG